jgi:hypothetical protein
MARELAAIQNRVILLRIALGRSRPGRPGACSRVTTPGRA